MDSKLKSKLTEIIEQIKGADDITSKSPEQIKDLLKTNFSESLHITPEKWERLSKQKLLKFDLEDMSVEQETLDTILNKLSNKIKKEKDEPSNNSAKKINLTLTFSESLKEQISKLSNQKAFDKLKDEILTQAKNQNVSLETLNSSCDAIKDALFPDKKASLPENTTLIDAITYVSLSDIKEKYALNNENKPKEKSTNIREMVDNLLGQDQEALDAEKQKSMQ